MDAAGGSCEVVLGPTEDMCLPSLDSALLHLLRGPCACDTLCAASFSYMLAHAVGKAVASAGGSPNKALAPKEEEDGGAEPASPLKQEPQQPLKQLPKPAAVSSEESYDWLLCEETLSDSEVDEPAPPKVKNVGKAKAVSLAALLSLCCTCHLTSAMLTKP